MKEGGLKVSRNWKIVTLALSIWALSIPHPVSAQGTTTTTAPCPPPDTGSGDGGGGGGVQATLAAEAADAANAGDWPSNGGDDPTSDDEKPEVKLTATKDGSGAPFKDSYFDADGGETELYFSNDTETEAPGSCPGGGDEGVIAVSITIDGPPSRFFSPYPSGFMLNPGDEKTINIRLTDFEKILVYLQADRLFAANIRVVAEDDAGKEHLNETFNIVRFLSVVNAREGMDSTALFLKALADGAGGFERKKPIDLYLPSLVETTFVPAGGNTAVFDPGPDHRGAGRREWKFNPTEAGQTEAELDVYIDSEKVDGATLTLRGTGVAPTELGVGRRQYEALLLEYLRDEISLTASNFSGTNEDRFRRASKAFKDEFDGFLASQAPSGFGLAQFRVDQEARARQAGAALLEAVRKDYEPLNLPNAKAFKIVGDGGDITTRWLARAYKYPETKEKEVLGAAERDVDLDSLREILPDDKLPLVAREYHFAELLNLSPTNAADFGLLRQPNFGRSGSGPLPNPPSFADFVANTVSHEFAHTFGIRDAYWEVVKNKGTDQQTTIVINRPPYDVMREGVAWDLDLTFDPRHATQLRAAMGIAPDAPGALLEAINLFRNNINLPGSRQGVRDFSELEDALPVLAVGDEGGFLASGDRRLFEGVAADGPGGKRVVADLYLSNVGGKPLTVADAVVDGPGGHFGFDGESPAGRTLETNETVPLRVAFDPLAAGAATGSLRLVSDDAIGEDFVLALEGEGLPAGGRLAVEIAEDPAWGRPSTNLGGARVGGEMIFRPGRVKLRNTGGGPLAITAIEGDGPFGVAGTPLDLSAANPIRLGPGEERPIGLTFAADRAGLQRGEIRVTSDGAERSVVTVPVIATGIADSDPRPAYGEDFVAIELLGAEGDHVLHAKSDRRGFFQLDLPAETDVHLVMFDPETGLIAHDYDRTSAAGRATWLSRPVFGGSAAPDSDGDFLPDDVELALGTDAGKTDSDGDGISDFDELQRGSLSVSRKGRPAPAAPSAPTDAFELLEAEIRALADRVGLELGPAKTQSRGSERTIVFDLVGEQPASSEVLAALSEWIEANGGEVASTFVSGGTGLLEGTGVRLGDRTARSVQAILGSGRLAVNVRY